MILKILFISFAINAALASFEGKPNQEAKDDNQNEKKGSEEQGEHKLQLEEHSDAEIDEDYDSGASYRPDVPDSQQPEFLCETLKAHKDQATKDECLRFMKQLLAEKLDSFPYYRELSGFLKELQFTYQEASNTIQLINNEKWNAQFTLKFFRYSIESSKNNIISTIKMGYSDCRDLFKYNFLENLNDILNTDYNKESLKIFLEWRKTQIESLSCSSNDFIAISDFSFEEGGEDANKRKEIFINIMRKICKSKYSWTKQEIKNVFTSAKKVITDDSTVNRTIGFYLEFSGQVARGMSILDGQYEELKKEWTLDYILKELSETKKTNDAENLMEFYGSAIQLKLTVEKSKALKSAIEKLNVTISAMSNMYLFQDILNRSSDWTDDIPAVFLFLDKVAKRSHDYKKDFKFFIERVFNNIRPTDWNMRAIRTFVEKIEEFGGCLSEIKNYLIFGVGISVNRVIAFMEILKTNNLFPQSDRFLKNNSVSMIYLKNKKNSEKSLLYFIQRGESFNCQSDVVSEVMEYNASLDVSMEKDMFDAVLDAACKKINFDAHELNNILNKYYGKPAGQKLIDEINGNDSTVTAGTKSSIE